MELTDFIKNFAAQFDETDPSLFVSSTKFREEIEEWDSLKALSIIAMVDDEYGVIIKGDDIRSCITIEDLYNFVISKK